MVTWGQNQVFTFGGTPASAPTAGTAAGTAASPAAPFSFGAPSPAPSTGFGSTPAPASVSGSLFGTGTPASSPAPPGGLFGTSAPSAAPTGGFFGASTPAPAPPGSFFGASTPAPATGGLFGSQAPAPSGGGLFGAPAPSGGGLFGSMTPSTGGRFGAPAPAASFGTQAAGPQIPAQAAMQAHMDASARQEAAKLQAALEKVHAAYTGAPTADKHKFVSIFYDEISPEQQQLQHAMGGQPVPPPKPPHVSDEDWLRAVVQNPDPNFFMPVAHVGADALQTRLARAQDRANSLSKGIECLHESHATLAHICAREQSNLQCLARAHTTLRTSLLQVMKKVELARNMNLARQADEAILEQRLRQALKQVDQVNKLLASAQAKAKAQSQSRTGSIVNVPDERELARVLKGHRKALTSMVEVMEKDMRDMKLLKQHVAPKVRIPPRLPQLHW